MDDDEKGSEQRGTKGDNLKHPHHLQPVWKEKKKLKKCRSSTGSTVVIIKQESINNTVHTRSVGSNNPTTLYSISWLVFTLVILRWLFLKISFCHIFFSSEILWGSITIYKLDKKIMCVLHVFLPYLRKATVFSFSTQKNCYVQYKIIMQYIQRKIN